MQKCFRCIFAKMHATNSLHIIKIKGLDYLLAKHKGSPWNINNLLLSYSTQFLYHWNKPTTNIKQSTIYQKSVVLGRTISKANLDSRFVRRQMEKTWTSKLKNWDTSNRFILHKGGTVVDLIELHPNHIYSVSLYFILQIFSCIDQNNCKKT